MTKINSGKRKFEEDVKLIQNETRLIKVKVWCRLTNEEEAHNIDYNYLILGQKESSKLFLLK